MRLVRESADIFAALSRKSVCVLTCVGLGQQSLRLSFDGIQEEGNTEQRHVKFNIGFDEWRR